MSRILIACGGTGGHLAPGIAVAERLQERGNRCDLLISRKSIDVAMVEKYPHLKFHTVPGQAFSGNLLRRVAAALSMVRGFVTSWRLIRREKPDGVVLFGGFLSVGLGLAGRLLRIPVAIHEANCKPGRAVRLLKHFARRIFLPDGLSLRGVSTEKVRYYGYPVRKEIRHSLKVDAWRRLGIEVPNKLLVVIGGSQGAAALNRWVVDHFETLARRGVSVYCVTGPDKSISGVMHSESPSGERISATFVPFSDRMGDVLSAADLVVSRAGAGSIAEIIRCRAPTILIPYPYAQDAHQDANASVHEQHGGGMVLAQDSIERLIEEVNELIFNDWLLSKFKANLARIDRPDATERIARDLERLCVSNQAAEAEAQTAT